jgi:two-component system cell cycle sensor histidine kinase PleC
MARIESACPGDESAPAQASQTGLATWLKDTRLKEQFASDLWLQTAAGLHLMAIAGAVLDPSSPPLPLFLTLTGLALVVLALTRSQTPSIADNATSAGDARTTDLERQSQRLFEIADTASRARREAEMRGHLWAELTARMSHELRTPLNAVIGFSDLMSAELFGPLGHDRYRDYTRHIHECGRTLLKCTEDTLALTSSLAKTDGVEPVRTLHLDDLVREAADFHASETATRGLKLIIPTSSKCSILGETRSTRQILVNLLAEAMERARRGGSITVEVREDVETVSLSITVEKAVPRADVGQAPLPVCIARVLLEQQGSSLIETDDHESWQVTTFFDRPTQADFFAPHN